MLPTMKTVVDSGMMVDRAISHLVQDDCGQDLIEYALVAAMLSLCAVASLKTFAGRVAGLYVGIGSGLNSSF
jgi:Flp pilus assembly pilin Flp